MIIDIDITKTKAWAKLKELGFYKIRFTFQGLAYSYGAGIKLPDLIKNHEHIEIEPFRRHYYSKKKDKNIIRIEWRIITRCIDHTYHSRYVLSSRLEAAVIEEIEFVKSHKLNFQW